MQIEFFDFPENSGEHLLDNTGIMHAYLSLNCVNFQLLQPQTSNSNGHIRSDHPQSFSNTSKG